MSDSFRVVFMRSIRQPAVQSPRCVRSVNMFVFLKALLAIMLSPLIAARAHFLVSEEWGYLRKTYPPTAGLFYRF